MALHFTGKGAPYLSYPNIPRILTIFMSDEYLIGLPMLRAEFLNLVRQAFPHGLDIYNAL